MGEIRYMVELDGTSARLKRERTVMRRRWLGFRRPVKDTETTVVGIFPCRMGLSYSTRLSRPSELSLILEGQRVNLHAAVLRP